MDGRCAPGSRSLDSRVPFDHAFISIHNTYSQLVYEESSRERCGRSTHPLWHTYSTFTIRRPNPTDAGLSHLDHDHNDGHEADIERVSVA